MQFRLYTRSIPISINNQTDPFLNSIVAQSTIKILKEMEKNKMENPVMLITKGYISEEYAKILSKINLNIIVLYTFSGLSEKYENRDEKRQIETMEILKGVVDNVKPKLLIVIDALASRSIDRISSSIQIADTGIVPGAGVENKRKEISKKTLGIPVIAIGIPTVVDLATVTNECIDIFIENLQEKAMSNDYLNKLKEKDNYEDIKEALVPKDYNMIVTPKEIDKLIENMSKIISKAINMAM